MFAALLADGLILGASVGTAVSMGRQEAGGSGIPVSASQKVAALTFDDGPDRECTGRLLDGLRERGVKASFFLMGQNIEGNEELVRQMQRDGHLIGNHGYSHEKMTADGLETVCESIEHTQKLIESITGEAPLYLRPPYGDWSEELECRLDVRPILWSVDSLDWKLKNAQAIVRRVEGEVENGDIILMHDIFPDSVDAALQLVDRMLEEGYAFVTVDELMID